MAQDKMEDLLLEEEDASQDELSGGESSSFITWLSNMKVRIICVIIVFLILKWKLRDLRHRWFAAFLQYMLAEVDVKKEEMKKDLFTSMQSHVSHDPALRKEGAIKILEIGVGTGTNFTHYPDGTRLTVVDPNPHFKQYYNENRKKFPNIHSEDIIVTTGEEMDMIPDNSMDVVVVTMVLCSVDNTKKILKQILRVLAPGGKFYFYEHIKEFDIKNHSTRRMLQTFLTKSGIWPFLLDNCMLDRDMLQAIEETGFSKVDAERFHAPIDHFVFQLIKPSLKGWAQK